MKNPMWIMVAGPYSSGNATAEERTENLRLMNAFALAVFRKGHIPIIGVNLAQPLIDVAGSDSYDEIMMPLSLAVTSRCDAVLRVGGISKGADQEVERIRSQGGTVYESLGDIPMGRLD